MKRLVGEAWPESDIRFQELKVNEDCGAQPRKFRMRVIYLFASGFAVGSR